MAPRPSVGGSDGGWTPGGAVMALIAVLTAVVIMSHLGVSTGVLLGVVAVAALVTVFARYRLEADEKRKRADNGG